MILLYNFSMVSVKPDNGKSNSGKSDAKSIVKSDAKSGIKSSQLAGLGLLLIAFLWGIGFVFVKESLTLLPPFYLNALRFTFASLGLSVIFAKKLVRRMTKKVFVHGLVLGIFLGIAYSFQTLGCVYTSAGKNALFTSIYIILVPIFSCIQLKVRLPVRVFVAAIMAFAGIALLSGALSGGGNAVETKGDVLTLVCGVFFAFHLLYIAKYTKTDSPIVLAILQLFFACVLSWIAAPFFDGDFPVAAFSDKATFSRLVGCLVYLTVFSTMVTFLLQNVCQKYVSSSAAALLVSFESPFGFIASALLLGEVFTPAMVSGAVLIVFALFVSEGFLRFEKLTKLTKLPKLKKSKI
ncbi:MAG: DMT family transporter [Treponemataceae bacterium]|nr:MAG: DMT family transporter [Treponemataceae bacterium]